MTPLPIETSTPQERREWIRKEFPCISCCENCGLCQVYHGRDVEDVTWIIGINPPEAEDVYDTLLE